MDPSMLIAFLITSEADFKSWKQSMQEVQGKCIVHVSQSEPSVKGLEEMILTETDDAEGEGEDEEGEGELVERRKESKPSFDEGDGELIEARTERKEAVDEVEALPDHDEDEDHIHPPAPLLHSHPTQPTTLLPPPSSTPIRLTKQKSELGDDDGEIINMPTSSPFTPVR